ncbi:extracellular solute-binding protein [Breznakiella homolactica]|uniref:Extracellular solute-binding protein n=1 Tax=Breznakiella homolactica TaxID=2798577 RepID=A0A7T8BC46_9SPIR|nr:extracellular solute-binding protein [Breznakiella homolactica]QQO10775.1 extracellular solute-binding protein [Breznakiella homolactica]
MKKLLNLMVIVGAGCVLLFTACSGGGGTSSSGSSNQAAWTISQNANLVKPEVYGNPNAENTITFWTYRVLSPSSNYPRTAARITERIESWARKNPDTKVQVDIEIPAEKTNEFMVKIYESMKAGNAPSIAHVDSFFLPKLLDKEAGFKQTPQAFDPYLTKGELDNYFESYREFCTDENGSMIAHFVYTDVRVLWYRKDLMDAPPKTWDELISITKRLQSQGRATEGILTQGGRHENTFFYFVNMFWAAGGELVDASGKPVFAEGRNKQIMLDSLKLYKRLVDEGIMPSKVASIAGSGDLNAAVNMSMPPFILTGGWIDRTLPLVIGDEKFENYAIAPIPTLQAGQRPVSGAGGWSMVVLEQDPKLRAKAIDFLWHVYGGVEGMLAASEDGIPTFKNVAENWVSTETSRTKQESFEMLQYARLRPAAASYSDISLAMQVAIGEVILGTKTPEQALDDAWNEVMSVYNL